MFNFKQVDVSMDFQGQKEAKRNYKIIIWTAAFIGWIIGFIQQSFFATTVIVVSATVGACLFCVPPYSRYRQNQIQFLDADKIPKKVTVDKKKKGK